LDLLSWKIAYGVRIDESCERERDRRWMMTDGIKMNAVPDVAT
jgi:hypothetical protein